MIFIAILAALVYFGLISTGTAIAIWFVPVVLVLGGIVIWFGYTSISGAYTKATAGPSIVTVQPERRKTVEDLIGRDSGPPTAPIFMGRGTRR